MIVLLYTIYTTDGIVVDIPQRGMQKKKNQLTAALVANFVEMVLIQ